MGILMPIRHKNINFTYLLGYYCLCLYHLESNFIQIAMRDLSSHMPKINELLDRNRWGNPIKNPYGLRSGNYRGFLSLPLVLTISVWSLNPTQQLLHAMGAFIRIMGMERLFQRVSSLLDRNLADLPR